MQNIFTRTNQKMDKEIIMTGKHSINPYSISPYIMTGKHSISPYKIESPKFDKYPEYNKLDPLWKTHSRFGHMTYKELIDATINAEDVTFEMTGKHLPDGTFVKIINSLVRETDAARFKDLTEKINGVMKLKELSEEITGKITDMTVINELLTGKIAELNNQLENLTKNMARPLHERTDRAYIPVRAYQTEE